MLPMAGLKASIALLTFKCVIGSIWFVRISSTTIASMVIRRYIASAPCKTSRLVKCQHVSVDQK